MAFDAEPISGTPRVEEFAKRAALESDIRRVAQATWQKVPDLAEAALVARAILECGDAQALANSITWGDVPQQPWHATLNAYLSGLEMLARPQLLHAHLRRTIGWFEADATYFEDAAAEHQRASRNPNRLPEEREESSARELGCRGLAETSRGLAAKFRAALASLPVAA